MGSVKRTKSHREREDSLVVVLSPAAVSHRTQLQRPPYATHPMNDTQWQGTWNRGQSLPRRNLSGSRAGRFASSSVSSEFSSVKWNADVTVLWGQGIIYPLYSFQSYCPAPQSANKDHLLLFCVCIECGKFLKVYPFLP